MSNQDKLLLTPVEKEQEITKLLRTLISGTRVERIWIADVIAEAQLAKADPLIRKDERERIIITLDKLLKNSGFKGSSLRREIGKFIKTLQGENNGSQAKEQD